MTKKDENQQPIQQQESSEKGINAFVLMFLIIVIMTVLTYILPASEYARVEVDGRTVVDPSSYEVVERTPVGILDMFNSVHAGLVAGGPIILFVFLFGGALGIMQRTGAIDAFIKFIAARFGRQEKLLIPLFVLIFSLLGTLIGSAEDTLVYIAIIVPMTMVLKMDAITGFAIVMLGTMSTGFTSGITNPFNVAVAQSIAELPTYSGMGLRIGIFVAFYVVTVIFIYRHAVKVKQNPELGIYGKYDPNDQAEIDMNYKISGRHKLALFVLLANFIALIVGVIKFGWYIGEIGGIFLFSAIVMGIIGKVSSSKMADGFIDGAKEMVAGALIIGVAQTILVIAQDGKLLDTILHFAVSLIDHLPASINAIGMFIVQLFINFLVPSGSGQAALTMPLMTPLADMIGVTRQTAVFAFQMGDGISNIIIPTSGVLLAGLAIVGIPFTKWVKWVLPFFLWQVAIAIVFIIIAQAINYGPF